MIRAVSLGEITIVRGGKIFWRKWEKLATGIGKRLTDSNHSERYRVTGHVSVWIIHVWLRFVFRVRVRSRSRSKSSFSRSSISIPGWYPRMVLVVSIYIYPRKNRDSPPFRPLSYILITLDEKPDFSLFRFACNSRKKRGKGGRRKKEQYLRSRLKENLNVVFRAFDTSERVDKSCTHVLTVNGKSKYRRWRWLIKFIRINIFRTNAK